MSVATTGLRVEIVRNAAGNTAGGTYTDVTSRVLSLSIDRGRSSPHDRFGAGQLQVTFDNADRAFDRTFAAGPFYGVFFDAGMRIRVTETVHSQTLAQGFVEDWPMDWGRSGGTVTLTAYDALRLAADAQVPRMDVNESSVGERITNLFNVSGVAGGWLATPIDTGQCLMQAGQAEGGLLELMHQAAESDNGVIVGTKVGQIAFWDRHAFAAKTRQATSQWTFSPSGAGGTVPYSAPSVGVRRGLLINQAVIARSGSTETPARAINQTSIDRNGPRGRTRTDLIHSSITDSQAIAQMLVEAWATPAEPATITLEPTATSQLAYEAIVRLELRDLVTVEWSPGNATPRNTAAMTVERISIRAANDRISCTLGLAPARLQTLAGSTAVYAQANSTSQANSTKKVAP